MSICRMPVITGLLALVSLTSCGLSGREFVDRSVGYAVTRGRVIRVDSLNAEHMDYLSDGVAMRVEQPGCRVSMKLGEPTQVIDVTPGSILVLGKEHTWVLVPYDGPPVAPQPQPITGTRSASPPPSAAVETGPPPPGGSEPLTR